ncbi:hypothetical protein [Kitasatospora sp. HPMI-4]|uniref:hypothetical protein n=1 Tax=Kitasatospora sp. HPMI-4 TaxID=3448443 RepID=UPI003F1DC20C
MGRSTMSAGRVVEAVTADRGDGDPAPAPDGPSSGPVHPRRLMGLGVPGQVLVVPLFLAPMIALFSWTGTRIIQGMTVGIGT